jgi:hypothetical protein
VTWRRDILDTKERIDNYDRSDSARSKPATPASAVPTQ